MLPLRFVGPLSSCHKFLLVPRPLLPSFKCLSQKLSGKINFKVYFRGNVIKARVRNVIVCFLKFQHSIALTRNNIPGMVADICRYLNN